MLCYAMDDVALSSAVDAVGLPDCTAHIVSITTVAKGSIVQPPPFGIFQAVAP